MATEVTPKTGKRVRFDCPELSAPSKRIKKGFAFIISHEKFSEENKIRYGNELDLQRLHELMSGINFDVRVVKDKGKDEIKTEIESLFTPELYNSPDYKDELRVLPKHECVIVIVMTHGDCGDILLDSNMDMYHISDVWRPFVNNVAPEVPIIFIFQACRGEKHDIGKCLPHVKCDSTARQEQTCDTEARPEQETHESTAVVDESIGSNSECNVTVPNNAENVVFAYSTVRDLKSWRCTLQGTYYICRLCEAFKLGVAQGEDLVTILTRAQSKVAYETIPAFIEGNVKQMPAFTSFLPYTLYFNHHVTE